MAVAAVRDLFRSFHLAEAAGGKVQDVKAVLVLRTVKACVDVERSTAEDCGVVFYFRDVV